MLRKRFNLNNLFSEFDSFFEDFNSPLLVRGKRDVERGNDENGKNISSGVLSEFSKLIQLLVVCYPRDWSSHKGKHAIWVLESIIGLFEFKE